MNQKTDSPSEFSTLDLKCGEVFLDSQGNLILVCTLCETQYKEYQQYSDHVMEKHFLFDSISIVDNNTSSDDECLLEHSDEQEDIVLNIKDKDDSESIEEIEIVEAYDFEEDTSNPMEDEKDTKEHILEAKKRNEVTTALEVKEFIYNCSSNSKTPDRMRYYCGNCQKGFYSKSGFRIHTRSHNTTFQCDRVGCGKSFFNLYSYRRHKKRCTEVFECPECEMILNDKVSFQKHKKTHSHPFKCKKCSINMKTIDALEDHMLTHSGMEEMVCQDCSLVFYKQNDLLAHIKIKHAEDGPVKVCIKQT